MQNLGEIAFKKKRLSAGIWTLRAANDSTLWITNFSFNFETEMSVFKKIFF